MAPRKAGSQEDSSLAGAGREAMSQFRRLALPP